MSAPARRLQRQPAHGPGRRRGTDAARTVAPARRAPAPPTAPARRPATRSVAVRAGRRRARRHHLGFVVLASAIVGTMLFAIVVLQVLVAQQSFRIDAAEARLQSLSTSHLDLLRTQATLSAPDRISTWATRHGMRLPDSIRILRAPKAASDDPAGAGTTLADVAEALERR